MEGKAGMELTCIICCTSGQDNFQNSNLLPGSSRSTLDRFCRELLFLQKVELELEESLTVCSVCVENVSSVLEANGRVDRVEARVRSLQWSLLREMRELQRHISELEELLGRIGESVRRSEEEEGTKLEKLRRGSGGGGVDGRRTRKSTKDKEKNGVICFRQKVLSVVEDLKRFHPVLTNKCIISDSTKVETKSLITLEHEEMAAVSGKEDNAIGILNTEAEQDLDLDLDEELCESLSPDMEIDSDQEVEVNGDPLKSEDTSGPEDETDTDTDSEVDSPLSGGRNDEIDSDSDYEQPSHLETLSKLKSSKAMKKTTATLSLDDESSYRCSTCDKGFRTSSKLREHEETHKPKKERTRFLCPMCGASVFRRGWRFHKKYVCNPDADADGPAPKLHRCSLCEKTFGIRQYLDSHVKRMHSQMALERLFQCEICAATYKEKGNLTRHMKTHFSDSPKEEKLYYPCGKGCGRKLLALDRLKKHEATCGRKDLPEAEEDEDITPKHKCPHCEMTFKFQRYVRDHVRRKHSNREVERPFQCEECAKTFKFRKDLNQHMKHHAEKVYKCGKGCGRDFSVRNYWKSHEATCDGVRIMKEELKLNKKRKKKKAEQAIATISPI